MQSGLRNGEYMDWGSSQHLEEESQDLSSEMLPPGLLVVHDSPRGGQHHV